MIRQTGGVDLRQSFAAFVAERYPFAAAAAIEALAAILGTGDGEPAGDPANRFRHLRPRLEAELRRRLTGTTPAAPVETTPGVAAPVRYQQAVDDLVAACDGFLARAAVRASLTPDERR